MAIVGGALQGMEAVLLSKAAGYETVVLDRKPGAPALSLCDEPMVLDPTKDPDEARMVFSGCDAVIPACEEMDLLRCLDSMDMGVPLLFDLKSYNTSSSKNRSNEIMASVGVPLPQPWPQCGFPAIVKPSSQSGSIGVSVAMDEDDMKKGLEFIARIGDEPVIQEFVHGKSVSIEVIGDGRKARSYVTTEVCLDSNYDCKMVRCNPDVLSEEDDALFGKIGRDVAEAMGLSALMDVEAILTPKGLRVLEIDARIPSQTPAAIQAATGVNLLEELATTAMGKPADRKARADSSVYRHVVFKDGVLRSSGEKEFGHVSSPRFAPGLFGCENSITDYEPGKKEWRATLISSGRTEAEADAKAQGCIDRILDECSIDEFVDGTPEMV
ncbi:MAG: 3-methylornithine--L-lysine ligase PylC [Candidatus Methanomethylophilaceae archaeon]|nr:3-methylornithine--L-lysine ligase PylC [Candidatus Methanomethylophilaceae archaeon]